MTHHKTTHQQMTQVTKRPITKRPRGRHDLYVLKKIQNFKLKIHGIVRQVLSLAPCRRGRRRCTWCRRRTAPSDHAATIAASSPSRSRTGTPCPAWWTSLPTWTAARSSPRLTSWRLSTRYPLPLRAVRRMLQPEGNYPYTNAHFTQCTICSTMTTL
jgi:hypothetical protein